MASTPGEKIATALITAVVNVLLTGLVLMVVLPKLGVVGLPAIRPSFWTCVAIGMVTKWAAAELGTAWRVTSRAGRK